MLLPPVEPLQAAILQSYPSPLKPLGKQPPDKQVPPRGNTVLGLHLCENDSYEVRPGYEPPNHFNVAFAEFNLGSSSHSFAKEMYSVVLYLWFLRVISLSSHSSLNIIFSEPACLAQF